MPFFLAALFRETIIVIVDGARYSLQLLLDYCARDGDPKRSYGPIGSSCSSRERGAVFASRDCTCRNGGKAAIHSGIGLLRDIQVLKWCAF